MNKIGKNKKNKGFVVVGNKKYPYSIEDLGVVNGEKTVFFDCKDAKISQEFLAEDVSGLLIDLPELILSEKDYSKKQSEVIRFRVSSEDKAKIEKKAFVEGFSSVSNYLREVALGKRD